MSKIHTVSYERHSGKRWLRPSNYLFAAADIVCPLVIQELPKATLCLPIAFLAEDSTYTLVSVQGLESGKNLFVGADGSWLTDYVPAAYRGYPFLLADSADGNQVLCINEENQFITEDTQAESFFSDDGTPSLAVTEVLNFLTRVYSNRQATKSVIALLQKYNLIKPWSVTLTSNSGQLNIEGLHRIDEATLSEMDGDALIDLQSSGALLTAYCQILSVQHLHSLTYRWEAKQKTTAALPRELDLEYLTGGENISFGNL